MKNEFVKYEQAVALKELGFDEDCFGYYIKVYDRTHLYYINPDDIGSSNGDDKQYGDCTAPTYSQAFRWFREVHGLYPEVHSIVDIYGKTVIFNAHINHLPKDESIGCFLGKYETYEEAESACLDKLIEICKNK